MTQPPDETPDPLAKPAWGDEPTMHRPATPGTPGTPDFLAKPVPPSGEPAPPAPPSPPASPYTNQPPPAPSGPSYAPPPAPAPGYQQPYGGAPAYGGAPGYPFAQAHKGATTSMILGIVSLVCMALGCVCYFPFIGVLCAPFAIVLAVRSRSEIRASPGLYNNEGYATAGLVCGIIGTIIGAIAILLTIFFFGAILASS